MPAGAYGLLYEASADALWPDRPGRMVKRAAGMLAPGAALDLGCGDGKNAAYLAASGWLVDGCDVSARALEMLERRFTDRGLPMAGRFECCDAARFSADDSSYDLAVCYGLFHCLSDDQLGEVIGSVGRALRPGGLLAVAALTPDIPLPADHLTPGLHLRSSDAIIRLLEAWQVEEAFSGVIREDHLPAVAEHEHSVLWALLRKTFP